jgi:hypothetical protein
MLALAAYPSLSGAEPDIPSWCCPSTCQVIDGTVGIVLATEQRGATALSWGEKKIPFSKNLFRGDAPDGSTRVCIGFDAFGDPEIKCLFSPLPLT